LIRLSETGDAIEIRQDGRQKHGRDLTSLIPSVRKLEIRNDPNQKQYSFSLEFAGDLVFSSHVISDGTLRLLALLTVLDDPRRRGTGERDIQIFR
jgi:predicted ATPase